MAGRKSPLNFGGYFGHFSGGGKQAVTKHIKPNSDNANKYKLSLFKFSVNENKLSVMGGIDGVAECFNYHLWPFVS